MNDYSQLPVENDEWCRGWDDCVKNLPLNIFESIDWQRGWNDCWYSAVLDQF